MGELFYYDDCFNSSRAVRLQRKLIKKIFCDLRDLCVFVVKTPKVKSNKETPQNSGANGRANHTR